VEVAATTTENGTSDLIAATNYIWTFEDINATVHVDEYMILRFSVKMPSAQFDAKLGGDSKTL
jgi:hypothetical protein